MLYQTWNRTSVYFKLAVSASYAYATLVSGFKRTLPCLALFLWWIWLKSGPAGPRSRGGRGFWRWCGDNLGRQEEPPGRPFFWHQWWSQSRFELITFVQRHCSPGKDVVTVLIDLKSPKQGIFVLCNPHKSWLKMCPILLLLPSCGLQAVDTVFELLFARTPCFEGPDPPHSHHTRPTHG